MSTLARLTKQLAFKEVIKCGKDCAYFLNTYGKVTTLDKGIVRFALFPYQEDLIASLNTKRFNIVLKARQLGASTIIAGYILWYCLFHKDKNVVIVANKQKSARNVMRKARLIYTLLPKWLKVADLEIDNKNELEFTNRSRITAEATTMDAGASDSISLLLVDEAALIDNLEEMWGAIIPTLSTGGRAVVVSTPRGVGHQYHTLWKEAINGANEFVPMKLMWDARPDRNKAWFDKETKNMSAKKIAREYLCSFEQSGDTFFDGDTIEFITLNTTSKFDKLRKNPSTHVFKSPEANKKYLLSADVARGDGKDNSAFHVFDLTTREQVAEFESQMTTDNFAALIKFVGEMYNDATVVIENNNQGWSVLTTLKALGYSNIYYSKKGSPNTGGVGVYAYDHNPKYVMGFATSEFSRQQYLDRTEEDVRNKKVRIYGDRTIDEMKSFVWTKGKPKAQKGCNDDLIMSLGIGCWVMHTMFSSMANQDEMAKAFINAIFVKKKEFDIIKNEHGINNSKVGRGRPLYFGLKPGQGQTGTIENGPNNDLTWLLGK
jgi:hypothetical protein